MKLRGFIRYPHRFYHDNYAENKIQRVCRSRNEGQARNTEPDQDRIQARRRSLQRPQRQSWKSIIQCKTDWMQNRVSAMYEVGNEGCAPERLEPVRSSQPVQAFRQSVRRIAGNHSKTHELWTKEGKRFRAWPARVVTLHLEGDPDAISQRYNSSSPRLNSVVNCNDKNPCPPVYPEFRVSQSPDRTDPEPLAFAEGESFARRLVALRTEGPNIISKTKREPRTTTPLQCALETWADRCDL